MDPHLPFLKAVAANPADDLPRLVYADFLEETEEPVHVARAHFIRTQIALETFNPWTREYREAKALEQRLHESFEFHWLFDLPEYLRRHDRVTWRRGFPEQVHLSVAELTSGGEDLFSRVPITRLVLEPASAVTVAGTGYFQTVPALSRLTHLRFSPYHWQIADDDPDQEPLFASLMQPTGFPALHVLNFAGLYRISDAWLVRFSSRYPTASFAGTLEELDFSNCRDITDAGANTLATARGLDRLKVLRLTGITLSADSVAMLRRRFLSGLVV